MSSYAPCPKCQSNQADQVSFTWWGGLIGPRLLNHVKCLQCGSTYNGKTGQSNVLGITIYSIVLGIIAIGLGYLLYSN